LVWARSVESIGDCGWGGASVSLSRRLGLARAGKEGKKRHLSPGEDVGFAPGKIESREAEETGSAGWMGTEELFAFRLNRNGKRKGTPMEGKSPPLP